MRRLALIAFFIVLALTGCGGSGSGTAPRIKLQGWTPGTPSPIASRIPVFDIRLKTFLAPIVGEVFTTDNGKWSFTPTSFSYAWQDCDSNGNNCVTAAGSPTTTSRYAITSGDVTFRVRSVVTASDSTHTASQPSTPTGIINPPPPVSTGLPAISGTTTQGQTLTTTNGTWTSNGSVATCGGVISCTYQWQRCSPSCANIVGANGSTYVLALADVGNTILVIVTAANAGGSTPATSAQTATIASSGGLACTGAAVTTSTFATRVSGASAGDVLCLNTGSYGTWTGTNKAITVTAATGQTPTMTVNFGAGASGFTLNGMAGMSGTINAGTTNVTIKNSVFTGQIDIEGAMTNVVLDSNDLTWNAVYDGSANSKIFLNTTGASPGAALTVKNNTIKNGNLDGIHFGGGSGDLILNNRFQNLCDTGTNHTDNLQFEGGAQVRIAGNYVYEAQACATQGITSFDGGTNGLIIEDNVVDISRDWAIELYQDQGSILRHNTLVWHNAAYSSFGTGTGQFSIDHKTGQACGSGTVIQNNVGSPGGRCPFTDTANTDPSTVVYVGAPLGAASVFSDAFLTAGSPGHLAATDGLDTGIRHSVSLVHGRRFSR